MSHFSVAVFTNTEYKNPVEEIKRKREELRIKEESGEINHWEVWKEENQINHQEYDSMYDDVFNRVKKYIEYGMCEETDDFLKANNYVEFEVDEEEPEGGYYTNPNSFWDWFQVGGRWQSLAEKVHYKKIKELDTEMLLNNCYGFIDFENDYHSKGNMGWWGMDDSTNESKKEFENKFKQYLFDNPESYIIIVDFHV